jgi:hypothetical protein
VILEAPQHRRAHDAQLEHIATLRLLVPKGIPGDELKGVRLVCDKSRGQTVSVARALFGDSLRGHNLDLEGRAKDIVLVI